jgi:hypothetical protein
VNLHIMSDLHLEMHADRGGELIRGLTRLGSTFSCWRATSRWLGGAGCAVQTTRVIRLSRGVQSVITRTERRSRYELSL